MRLIRSEQNESGKWYLCDNTTKRWVTSIEALSGTGIEPAQLELVTLDELNTYETLGKVVKVVSNIEKSSNSLEAKAFLTKDFCGRGVEFGAATNPTPIPLNCTVEYADFFEVDEGCNTGYSSNPEEFVRVKYRTGFQDMDGISDNSMDFIISSHVIEHVTETLRSLKAAWEKLRKGGILFMVVPHQANHLDRKRDVTTLAHFVQDYEHYLRFNDVAHIFDFCVNTQENQVLADLRGVYFLAAKHLRGDKVDLHWHTFTEKNFAELLDYFNRHIHTWSHIEIIPRLYFPDANEFYVRITK